MARVALAWQLTKPFVTSIIIGAKRREQLVDNLAAAELRLSPEHVKLLDDASALPLEYPGWMIDSRMRAIPAASSVAHRSGDPRGGRAPEVDARPSGDAGVCLTDCPC